MVRGGTHTGFHLGPQLSGLTSTLPDTVLSHLFSQVRGWGHLHRSWAGPAEGLGSLGSCRRAWFCPVSGVLGALPFPARQEEEVGVMWHPTVSLCPLLSATRLGHLRDTWGRPPPRAPWSFPSPPEAHPLPCHRGGSGSDPCMSPSEPTSPSVYSPPCTLLVPSDPPGTGGAGEQHRAGAELPAADWERGEPGQPAALLEHVQQVWAAWAPLCSTGAQLILLGTPHYNRL